jgi:DNA-binding MarR family transcriptional regulator
MTAQEEYYFDSEPASPRLPVFLEEEKPNIAIKSSISRIWTPVLARRYTPVSRAFLEYYSTLGLTVEQALFVIHLIQHKWKETDARPGYRRLARLMGVSDKTARRYARQLEKKKFLIRIERKQDTNFFSLAPLFQALEKIVKEKEQEKKSSSRTKGVIR